MGEIEPSIKRLGNGGMVRELLAVIRGQGMHPIRQRLDGDGYE